MKTLYEILNIPDNSTDYEIYHSFIKIINSDSFNENEKRLYINAFIILSDINLRRNYDKSIGLENEDTLPWYNYTYFENGWNFFDINGNLGGDKYLTAMIEEIKGDNIRSSVPKENFFGEEELMSMLANYTDTKMQNKEYVKYIASEIDSKDLSDEEKFLYFKEIYNKYKKGFSFSQSFAKHISSKDYNSMEIEVATNYSAQQLLISKKGVCTNFASLIHEELKKLGLESYFLRMSLPHWYHHVVLYRVNDKWYICDLTNEYLFGRAGYKNLDTNYINIPLEEFVKNNNHLIRTTIVPMYGGDSFLEKNSIDLTTFLKSKTQQSLKSK